MDWGVRNGLSESEVSRDLKGKEKPGKVPS